MQGQDGQWWVLEDNLRIPSGASYPLFARDIERRITPSLVPQRTCARQSRLSTTAAPIHGFRLHRRHSSGAHPPAGTIPRSSNMHTWPRKPARRSRSPKTSKSWTTKVYFLDYAGRKHRVGVVYRRLSDEYLDLLRIQPGFRDRRAGNPYPPTGRAMWRSSTLRATARPTTKGHLLFRAEHDPLLSRRRADLHNAPTYMPMFDKDRKGSTRPARRTGHQGCGGSGRLGVVFGSSLDRSRREELAERIKAEPRRFIAQEVINSRTSTWWTPKPDR